MTTHPIDTEALREHLRRLIDASAGPGNPTVSIDDLRALLDALAAAEHRATRAEAQSEARRIDTEYWRGVARGNAIAADVWKESAEEAEARVKAVEDVLEESEARGPVGMTFNGTPFPAWVSIATIRRALDA